MKLTRRSLIAGLMALPFVPKAPRAVEAAPAPSPITMMPVGPLVRTHQEQRREESFVEYFFQRDTQFLLNDVPFFARAGDILRAWHVGETNLWQLSGQSVLISAEPVTVTWHEA